MDDLVRWLGEQLDEDERIARSTHPVFLAWEYDRSVREVRDLGNGNELVHGVEPRYGEHIVAHDPARVLREIDAKRQLLTVYEAAKRNSELPHPEFVEGVYPPAVFVSGYAAALEHALRLTASVYADRPGYREEWRP